MAGLSLECSWWKPKNPQLMGQSAWPCVAAWHCSKPKGTMACIGNHHESSQNHLFSVFFICPRYYTYCIVGPLLFGRSRKTIICFPIFDQDDREITQQISTLSRWIRVFLCLTMVQKKRIKQIQKEVYVWFHSKRISGR